MSSAEALPWPPATALLPYVGTAVEIASVDKYRWMVIVGGMLAFAMAWGIGANDVANAFATSVGAGSLTLPMACVIAAVMEFAGALLLGGSVTATVRKSVINTQIFDPNFEAGAANGPELLMTGFFVALVSATTWLVLATLLSLPVSTTHSIIGSLIGVGLAYGGGSAVVWWPEGSGLERLKGVVGVIISWVVSPLLSAIIAVIFFLIVRHAVLRRSDPFAAGLLFMPLFYGFTMALAIFFVVYKGDKRFNLSEKLGTGGAIGVALGAGVAFAILTRLFVSPAAKKAVLRWEEREAEKEKNPDAFVEKKDRSKNIKAALSKVGVNLDITQELDEDVVRMHDSVEKFDVKTERLFTWIQVFTAAVDAFAHGANDVANAIAPFSSIYQLHKNGGKITKPRVDEFDKAGKYKEGQLAGTSFEKGDLLPNHTSFCGKVGDKEYYKCLSTPVFPFKSVAEGDSVSFSVYDEDGKRNGEDGDCYAGCNSRNTVEYKSFKQDVPLWILALGGAGIVLGLAMWGYRIILAIGVKLTKLTPARGFSIEIGAAITVLVASEIGIPVSTTHCQVGATMGVGLVEGKASTVNWKQFFFICVGWVFTVIFTGFMSAILFLVITYSPMAVKTPQGLVSGENNLDFCPGNQFFVFDDASSQFRGISCAG